MLRTKSYFVIYWILEKGHSMLVQLVLSYKAPPPEIMLVAFPCPLLMLTTPMAAISLPTSSQTGTYVLIRLNKIYQVYINPIWIIGF